MGFSKLIALTGVLTLATLGLAHAADMGAMPEVPQIEPGDPGELEFGTNWYLRGDIGYAWSNLKIDTSIPVGFPMSVDGDGSTWTVGGGVGYDFGWVRTDITVDYFNNIDVDGSTSGTNCADGSLGPLCASRESSSFSALPILFNVYFDLGTWGGLTPYVGAGIGASLVTWDSWRTAESIDPATDPFISFSNAGTDDWRFTYALMAGASYAINANLSIDLGYRFTDIEDGKAVQSYNYAGANLGSIDYKDFYNHEVRVGFRWVVD